MLLFPVRVEDATVDRMPAVSIGIAAACAAAFLLTWVLPANPDGMRAEGFRDIVHYYEEHPYLTMQQKFQDDYLRPEARASFEEMHEDLPVTVDEATRALEQTHLDALIVDFQSGAESSLLRRFGLVPARGLLQPGWLTHMFLHFGWMHIIGNLFFFYLVGPLLEDLWGRTFFAGFYLVGGLVAGFAHFAMEPHSAVLMAGASGAVAACMGAFSYRCASRRIRMAYMIGFIRRGTFLIPAWLWGGFWFAGEVLSLVMHASQGVAVMAHIGGFLFGFAAAVAIEKSGFEAQKLAPEVEGKTTWTQHPGTEAARAALERNDPQAAAEAFRGVLQEQPLDREAAVGLSRLEQTPEAALPLLQNLATRGDLVQAWLVALELGPAFDPDRIPDKLAWQLAGGGEAAADAGDLPDRLDAAIGRRQGPLAAKALLRAAKRCMAAGRTAEAEEHLQAARALPNLPPEMRAQIEAAANPRETSSPRPTRAPQAAPAAAVNPAVAATPGPGAGAVRVLACKLIRLAEDALHVDVGAGKTRRVEFSRLVGIAAGVVATAQGASILTDFVLSWGDGSGAPSALRIAGAQLGLSALFPGLPTKEAYSRFLAHVLARTVGQPLPSREALASGDYPRFASVAALNAAFYGTPRE
jgi:membrane associated rhomboid family serine protease